MVTADRYHSENETSNRDLARRPADAQDEIELRRVTEPTIRAGEIYPLERDLSQTMHFPIGGRRRTRFSPPSERA
jgi:hypothetical protein